MNDLVSLLSFYHSHLVLNTYRDLYKLFEIPLLEYIRSAPVLSCVRYKSEFNHACITESACLHFFLLDCYHQNLVDDLS